jgi:vitamin B12 transporter
MTARHTSATPGSPADRQSAAIAGRVATTTAASLTALAALAAGLAAQQPDPLPLDTLHIAAGSRLEARAVAAARSVEVIDRARIEALPVRSVAELLARALGVDLLDRSPAQADLSIRGSGFEQVLVMVDGVPVNDAQTGHFHLSLAVPLDAIERIEVLRGPASALYGSGAVGGTVNIVTRGGAPALTARAQAGSFGSAAAGADARGSLGALSGRVSSDYQRSRGHRAGTDYTIIQARAGGDVRLAGGALAADAAWAARDFGADGFYAPFESYEETRTATASIAWRSAPAPVSVEPRVAFRQHDDDFVLVREDPTFYRNMHTTRQATAEFVARWTPAPDRLRLAAGGEATRSSLASTNLGDRTEEQAALFGELVVGNAAAAVAVLGLRADHHSAFGTHLSPSASAGLQATPRLGLRASAATGFRAPSWTDRYYSDPANVGDPDLGAERFRTVELGARLQAADALRLDGAVFRRDATDLIDWARPAAAPSAEPWRTRNVSRAQFTGAEATLSTRARAAEFSLRGTLLSVQASTPADMVSKYALHPLTRSLALDAATPLPAGFSVSLRAAAFRRAPASDWHLVDARLSRAVGALELFIDGTNLTHQQYLDIAQRPAAGRAWHVGGRMRR